MVGSRELAKRQTSPKGIFWKSVPWRGVNRIDKEQLNSSNQGRIENLGSPTFFRFFYFANIRFIWARTGLVRSGIRIPSRLVLEHPRGFRAHCETPIER